jgi:SAM-dependent methyltransferase
MPSPPRWLRRTGLMAATTASEFRTQPDMAGLHAAAQRGFSVEAASYARGRPGYPAALVEWVGNRLGVRPNTTVVDLGAGTGNLTHLLLQTGATVIAVEPVEAMLEKLVTHLPAVLALRGTAEAIPLESASVDAVVCAQAFHWFATEKALAEIHRVLKPGGRLGLIWNVRDEAVDWVAEITRIITPYEADAPRFYKGEWRQAFGCGLFSELDMTPLAYRHAGSAEEVIIDRFLSVSFIAALPPAEKLAVQTRLRALVATHPALRDVGPISFPYRTEAYSCRALPLNPV